MQMHWTTSQFKTKYDNSKIRRAALLQDSYVSSMQEYVVNTIL